MELTALQAKRRPPGRTGHRGSACRQTGLAMDLWFLCIAGGACLLLVLLTLPETARGIVGNGSISPPRINRTLLSLMRKPGGPRGERPSEAKEANNSRSKPSFPNPLTSLKLLLLKDVFIVLLCNGIYYMIYCCAQASLASLFVKVYDYTELQAGLIYIPFGIGCFVSLFAWGKWALESSRRLLAM